jgi:hypothetical protein
MNGDGGITSTGLSSTGGGDYLRQGLKTIAKTILLIGGTKYGMAAGIGPTGS